MISRSLFSWWDKCQKRTGPRSALHTADEERRLAPRGAGSVVREFLKSAQGRGARLHTDEEQRVTPREQLRCARVLQKYDHILFPTARFQPARIMGNYDMQKKRLGTSDMELTPIGVGAWAMGGAGWLSPGDRRTMATLSPPSAPVWRPVSTGSTPRRCTDTAFGGGCRPGR